MKHTLSLKKGLQGWPSFRSGRGSIKAACLTVLASAMSIIGFAQNINTYTFTQSSGTYTPITGGTVLAANSSCWDDNNFAQITIPFTFTYHGAPFTSLGVSNNGYAMLGGLTNTYYSIVLANQINTLAPYSADLYACAGAGHELQYTTLGVTPNRVFVVQYTAYGYWSGGLNEATFQIRLSETSNAVSFVYGSSPTPTSNTIYVGINGATVGDYNTRTGASFGSTTLGTNTNGISVGPGNSPASGLTFTWAPPLPCTGVPVGGTVAASPSQTTYCGSASPTLSVSGNTVGTGISYQWQNSTNGVTWNPIAGATTSSYVVPAITSSMLYRVNVTCSSGPSTTPSSPILINVAPNPVVSITSPVTSICNGGSAVLTGNGATSYVWAPGGATTSSVTVNPTTTTTYTVTGTLGSCTATGTRVLTVGQPFNITPVTATPASVCAGGSTVLSATVPQGLTSFCTPTYSSGTGSGDYIGGVAITGTTLSNTTGGAPAPYYTLYPTSGSTTATLNAGNTYTIVLQNGTYGTNAIAAWIDWNWNGTFDASEKLGETTNMGAFPISTSYSFTVPAGAYTGIHRLRVREIWNAVNLDPCAAGGFGETEDYNITITNGAQFSTITWTESVGGGTTLAATNTVPVNATNITVSKTYGISVLKDGCTATGSVSVTANPLPTATITTSTPTRCAGQQPSITITGTPNTNVVYSINGSNQPAVSTGVSGSVTFNAPAVSINTAYALVSAVTPATTCSATLTGGVNVTVNQRPSGYFTGTSTICKDDQINNFISFGSAAGVSVFPIYLTFSNGTTTYTDTAAGAGENFPVPSNVPGMYTYTLTSMTSGTNGCAALPGDMTGNAMMEVKALPTAVVTSADAGVCPGGNTTITLTFTGDAPFLFNYYDGTAVVGGTSNTTTFTFNPTLTATTTYYVDQLVASTIFCQATPADIADDETVTVYDTTTITSQPIAAITTCSETDATITMTAIGENLTYTWYENGVQVSGPNYTVNNNILTINNVSGLDGNQYYVIVHSDCGVDKTSTSTTINEDHTNNWSGTVGTNWDNAANWSCGVVPIVTTDVFVNGSLPNQPVVNIPNAVCHDFTLLGSGSLTFASNMQLSIYGDIMNTTGGTINGTGGKMILAGTVQNAAGPLTVDDLDVTGGGVKTFTNDVVVNGILNLVNGNIELGTANLTMTQPTAQTGGNPTSFIVTNGTGKVTGNGMGAVGGNPDAVTFHVGINNTSYTPVTLENLGDADNYSVRVINHVYEDGTGVIPTLVDNPVVDRTWMVEEGTAGGSIVNMTPSWNAPIDEINGFVQTNVFVTHYMGGEWTSTVGTSTDAPAATPGMFPGMLMTTEDSITTFSPFAVASTGQFPLAIRLGSITAANAGARNKVQWKSETEDAGDVYELESSADGRKFTKIATVAAKGEASTYMQWDESPVQGVNYYRVKLLNNDGTYSYSKVVTATVKGKDGFSIEAYPNPVKNMVSVKVDGVVAGNAKVVVTDVTGKVVRSATAVSNNGAEINVSDLASGVYLLNYSDDTRNESIKITKQ